MSADPTRPKLLPNDAHDRALLANVHPPGRVNPVAEGRYNLVVLGAGTAGLVAAAGAAGLGAKVALLEREFLGGDCLNFGCVPSKGLLRAAQLAQDLTEAQAFGVTGGEVHVDFGAAMGRMRRIRAELSAHDSVQRLTSLGVEVFLGQAKFVARDAVEVAGQRLRFARAIVATGARAAGATVPGLSELSYLTNETVFSLTELPRRLLVLGAGPIGCELAQAFRRFGSEVTLVSAGRLLPREDPEAAALLRAQFEREGIALRLEAKLVRASANADGKSVVFDQGRGEETAVADEILLALGRAPNVAGLDLQAAGVASGRTGIQVDRHLRTDNRRIYAAGDICSAYKFTHAADALARIALQNALFWGRKRADRLVMPWCTYTDPAIAHVGLYEGEARARGLDVATFTVAMAEIDRAALDGQTLGYARVAVERRSGRLLGGTLVARHAGELIGELTLAITSGLRLADLGATIHPYPTQSEVWKRLADAQARSRLTPGVKRALERLSRWRRGRG